MALNPLERKAAESLNNHLSGVAKKRSIKDVNGNNVLRRAAVTRVFPLVGLGIASAALLMNWLLDDDPQEKLEVSMFMVPVSIFFLIVYITMSISRSVYNQKFVSTRRIFKRKVLRMADIVDISYTRFYSGCLVIHGRHGEKLLVPVQTTGFLDFYQMLLDKLGTAKKIEVLDQQLIEAKGSTKQLLGIPENKDKG